MPTHRSLKPFAGAVILGLGVMATTNTHACSCTKIVSEAGTMSGMVQSGSSAIVGAMESGFQMTAQAQDASTAKQTKSLVSGLEAMTASLVSEIRQVPVTAEELERRQALADPAHQATEPCRYSDRAADMGSSQKRMVGQLENLTEASTEFNELPSKNNNPSVQSSSTRFHARAHQALKEREGIREIGPRLVNSGEQYGALTDEQVQDASLFTNLTTNPDPPARVENPATFSQIEQNVSADLQNLRMSLPQAVMNEIVAYESPSLSVSEDSWAARQFKMAGHNVEGEKVSYADLLKAMATHRIESPQWIANLAAKNKDGAIKDLAMAKADSAFLDYEIWKQEKHTALMLSQLLANNVRTNTANE